MIKALMITCFVLLLAVDRFIYRREVRRLPSAFRRLYLYTSIAAYLLFVVALVLYNTVTGLPTDRVMRLLIWIIWFFFLNAIPRILYFVISRFGMLIRRPRSWRIAGVAVAALVVAMMVFGATRGRRHIRVTHVTVSSDRLPASFDGMRVALFADVHLGTMIHSRAQLQRLVDAINAQNPDIVVFGGDMVNIKSDEFTPQVVSILGGVRSRYGNFAVLGNHDLGIYTRDSLAHPYRANVDNILVRYAGAGWQPLVNHTVYISNGQDSISVTGLSFPGDKRFRARAQDVYPFDFEEAYLGVPDSLYNICISHTPDTWDEVILGSPHCDLTLSGHVHAMQFKLSAFGLRWSPAEYKFRRWSGLYRGGRQYLYVNDGVGYVLYPMRVGTYPEVTVITLRKSGSE